MKTTGMVRRVDRLGRLVLPKEIRDTLGIKVGDGLEIRLDKDDQIILKKYARVQGIEEGTEVILDQLYERYGNIVLMTDYQHILYAKQSKGALYQGKKLTRMYRDILLKKEAGRFEEIEVIPQTYEKECYIYPIFRDDRLCGSFAMITHRTALKDVDENILHFVCQIVSQQLI